MTFADYFAKTYNMTNTTSRFPPSSSAAVSSSRWKSSR